MANEENYAHGYLRGTLSEPISLNGYLTNEILRGIPVVLQMSGNIL